MCLVLLWFLFYHFTVKSSCYVIIANIDDTIGTKLFDAHLNNNRLEDRTYYINVDRSADFIKSLVHVDKNKGIVYLKQQLKCSGIDYPNIFTLYIDSVSNGTIEYVSVPIRMYINGCEDTNNNDEYEDSIEHSYQISELRQWASDTLVAYALPGTSTYSSDPSRETCFQKSQLVMPLINTIFPATLTSTCRIQYIDGSDGRLTFEASAGDLVASVDFCVPLDPPWRIKILMKYSCDGNRRLLSPAEHSVKIVFWHRKEENEVSRVRRDTQNDGSTENKAPSFDKALYVASAMEEQPPGMSVCTVHAKSIDGGEVSYQMIPLLDSRSHSMFSIDAKSGVVTTAVVLDREQLDVHYFRVQAVDLSYRPFSSTTTLQINVLDANDHTPLFEATNGEYEATIRESAPAGSVVTTVRATDKDIGHNGEIEYNIQSVDGGGTANSYSDTFSLDSSTGVLTTRSSLDRETTEVYTVIVTATDQALPITERRSSSATVVVRVTDENDNYPQFAERTYSVVVPEDTPANQNTIIATVKATDIDEGQNAAIRYAIIGGNTQAQFSIDSQNGGVMLIKPLDYETMRSYRLIIRAQDGGSPSRSNTTQLLVNVKDVNDNAPRFYSETFHESVSENVPIGFSIVRVQAYDADDGENAEIKYSIADRDMRGDTTNNLPIAVDEKTGWVHTIRALDRETNGRYAILVTAQDNGVPPKYGSASVSIVVQDVNDNDPVFNPKIYEAVVSEDDPPGTPVCSVVATDPDENPRLRYEISSGNDRRRFTITTQNARGLITISQPLDYKQEKRVVLSVRVYDFDGRFDVATVYINITDANNFPPVFENAPYTATIFEDAPVGSTVLIVSATDGDDGQNAQITYSLAGVAGETTEFNINPQTGAIITTKPLDREIQSGYLLTVTAKDGGVPSLSDTTDVEISVADINDNPPVFLKSSYMGSVSEDALVGTSVLQVSATDVDTGLNGRIRYALRDGTEAFVIDMASGVIRTAMPLDRESVAQYNIEALAIDRGNPPLSGTTTVRIKIEDINDSPPTFESDKLVFYIPENSPIGTLVGELYAKDPDEGQNAVVQYSIIGGEDASSFTLISRQGSEKAELLTMIDVDYESPKKKYSLVVRAASPPLRTDAHVDVLVTDVNDNAPQLKDFQVIFNNFKDCFPAGQFGRIPAFDADVSSKLRYRILSGNNANLVHLDEVTGMLTLSSQLNTNVNKNAFMEVSVSDGVNEVKSSMQLTVRLVTEDMMHNSVTVRFSQMTQEAFLSPLLMYFVDGLAAIIPCPKENIYVFSIQEDDDVNSRILNVSFSARRADGRFYTPEYLQERVYLNRIVLSKLSTAQILPFDDNLCVQEPCLNFEQCLSILKFGNASQFISSDTVLFRPIYPVSTFACRCPSGFTGSNEHYMCDIEVNLCYSNPCENGGTCKRKEGGYTCLCASKYTGDNCEIDLTLSNCEPGICHSGSTCTPLPEGGFACDDCAQIGTYEHYDRICQLRGRSFPKNSFLTFSSLKQRHRFHLSLKFATLEESGLLLYNGRYNELHDFIYLEITDGGQSVQFTFSLGSDTAKVSASLPTGVNDGNWHVVTILYYNRTATITLDDCDTGLTIKYGHKLGYLCANTTTLVLEPRCDHLTETCHRYMDLTGPLQIGGLPSFLSSTATHIQNKDFIGCIADVRIDYKLLDFNSYVADNGTVIGCPERIPHCIEKPCKNGGTCSESWNTFHCECPNGWSGKDCADAVTPAWRFKGKGILSFNPLLRPIQLPWILSLSLRTLQPDSFIMSVVIGQNNSASISLEGGFIVHMLDGQMVTLSTGRVNDGLWHRVDITWLAGGGVRISLDYGRRTITRILNVKLQGLFMGKITLGSPEEERLNKKIYSPFVGCIQDIRMGTSQTLLQRATDMHNVQEGCDSSDPCAKNVCPVHSACIAQWEKYTCACDVGYVGASCSPVCETSPCHESATCIEDKDSIRGYKCICPSDKVSGEYCEERLEDICPASWWGNPVCGPCNCPVNLGYNPNCNKTTGQCSCKENYYQPEGSSKCIPCDCYPTGSYDQTCDYRTGQCRCRNGAIGRRCDACPNEYAEVTLRGCEVIYDKCPANFADGVWWSRTEFGSINVESCPAGSEGKITRLCDDAMGHWKPADIFNCTSEKFESLRKLLNMYDNATTDITTYLAIESSLLLKEATNNTEILYGNDVLIAEQAIQKLLMYEHSQYGLNLTHSQDKDYIQNLILAISRIIDINQSQQWRKIKTLTNETPDVIIRTVIAYLETLATNQRDTYTEPFEVVTKNMAFGLDLVTVESLFGFETNGRLDTDLLGAQTETVMLPDTSSLLDTGLSVNTVKAGSQVLGFKSLTSPTIVFPKYNNYMLEKSKFDTHSQIMIPMDLLGIRQINKGDITVKDDIKWSDSAVVGYVQYRNLGSLLPVTYDDTVFKRWGVDLMVASPIISVVIALNKRFDSNTDMYSTSLLNVVPLSSPVRIRLWLSYGFVSPRSNPQCVRWTTNRGHGEWTRAGCLTDIPDGQWEKTAKEAILINCTCNQLSTYAVLVDAVGMDYVAEFSFAEQVSSTIGFSIAVVALLATYALLSILRAKTNSSCICLNHTLCLLLTQCLFLLALKDRSEMVSDDFICKLTAIGLHYLWLTVISWYLVSALHLYRMLTEMRDVNHGQMGFYRALGYGLPAVIVALSVGVKTEQYGNYYFCWLSLYESVVWSLVGPISIMVICILIIMVMSLRAAFTLKEHVSGYGNLRTLLWLSVVSLPLLVAVWMLELLIATERDELLTYALSLLSAAQAIFMFCAIFFGNARVRMSVRRLLLRITGRKVPPLPEEDIDSPIRTTVLSPNNPPRSALSYRNAGVNTYEAARRQIGISASSTTSRSTGKTSSSPYRSDGQIRNTSTSTSNYDHSASDGPSNFQRVHHTSDSDSEGSACRRSLDLASSHSSDDDDCSTKQEPNRKNAGVSIRQSELMEYLPNVVQDSVNRRPGIQPPCHLNVMTNSQLFPNPKLYHNIMTSPQWSALPANGNNTELEENTYGEGNWRNSGVSDYDNSIVSGSGMNVHYLKRHFDGDYEETIPNGNEKYSFPYTAEEDHCPSPQHNGVSLGENMKKMNSLERNGNLRTSLRSETRGGYGGSHDINRNPEISSLRSLDMNRRIHSSHTSIERRAMEETPKRSGDLILSSVPLEGNIQNYGNVRRGSDMSLKSIEISRMDMESPLHHDQRLGNTSAALLQRRPIYGSNEFTIAESEKDTSETCV